LHLEFTGRLRLGVSGCLAGQEVRYDGGHKRDHWLMDRVAHFSELVPVCPESVLGTPRETVSLQRRTDGALRLVGNETGSDHSDQVDAWTKPFLEDFDLDALDGWVFKSKSPSCAVQRIDVLEGDAIAGSAPGRFASAVLERCSWLPAIDEQQLGEPAHRRHFLERAFARASWREFVGDLPRDAAERDARVAAWLARYDLVLAAREQRPVHGSPGTCDTGVLRGHGHLLFASLDPAPTRVGQVEAFRLAGDHLDIHEDERAGLAILVTEYEHGRIDVEVPRQLLRGLCARGGDAWLRSQRFFDPFPVPWLDPEATSLPWPVDSTPTPEEA
jgi:uncharacterized protein YbbK (DUF523 family)